MIILRTAWKKAWWKHRNIIPITIKHLPKWKSNLNIPWYRGLVQVSAEESSVLLDEAVSAEIQGQVVVRFIVDKEGVVSSVEAVSGPPELRDAAVRVIKKSGAWTPAVQNGRKVKSYKSQPVWWKRNKKVWEYGSMEYGRMGVEDI